MNDSVVSCPVCEKPVPIGRRTLGDRIECPECHAGFLVELRPVRSPEGLTFQSCATALPSSAAPGTSLSRKYELVGELGRGGQGVVYRVRPRGVDCEYALKFLEMGAATGDAVRDLSADLDHPNIVRMHVVGRDEDSGRPYAVYEIIEGRSLSAEIREGPLAVERAVDIIFQIIAGLAHSHGHGIVHRDLKPDNILITPDGMVKIADFGIGLYIGGKNELDPEADFPFVGTPGYAAPEQISGWGVVRASDVYALGMTLYEMVTGRLPFQAPSLEVLLHNQVHTDPPLPSRLRPDLPPPLEELILSTLRKNPAKRPASMEELHEKLSAVAGQLGLPVPLETVCQSMASQVLTAPGQRTEALRRAALVFVLLAIPVAVGSAAAWETGVTRRGVMIDVFALVAGVLLTLYIDRKHPGAMREGVETVIPLDPFVAQLLPLVPVTCLIVGPVSLFLAPDHALSLAWPLLAMWTGLLPAGVAWVLDVWLAPAREAERRGLGVLVVNGPPGQTVSLDRGPANTLPARPRARVGWHELELRQDGRSRRYRVRVEGPFLYPFRALGGTEGPRLVADESHAASPQTVVQAPALLFARVVGAAIVLGFVCGALVPARRYYVTSRVKTELALARRAFTNSEWDAALSHYRMVEQAGPNQEAADRILDALLRLRRYPEALERVSEALLAERLTAAVAEGLIAMHRRENRNAAAGAYLLAMSLERGEEDLKRWPEPGQVRALSVSEKVDALLALGKTLTSPRNLQVVLKTIDALGTDGERRLHAPVDLEQEIAYGELAMNAGLLGEAINHFRWILAYHRHHARSESALRKMGTVP